MSVLTVWIIGVFLLYRITVDVSELGFWFDFPTLVFALAWGGLAGLVVAIM